MKIIKTKTLKQAYGKLIKTLLKSKHVSDTKEIENCVIQIKNPDVKDFEFGFRKISEKYALGELNWYWAGSNSCEEIGKFAKKWLSITDDGITNNSAYGFILEKKYGFDQIEQVINLLKKDKNTRRAVLNISDPAIDRINTKDMQCTIAIQFLIRNNKLNTTVYMRSNDIIFGFPYDYIYFISLAYYISSKLGIELGTYTHIATSLHLYDSGYKYIIKNKDVTTIDFDEIIQKNYDKNFNNWEDFEI